VVALTQDAPELTRADKQAEYLRQLGPHQAALEAFCRRALVDPNSVQDALQSTLAHTFRDFHLFAEGTNFRAWIFRYLYLEIQNCNRKSNRNRSIELPPDISVEESWDLVLTETLLDALLENPDIVLDQCDAAVSQAVAKLSSTERTVFLLRSIAEFSYREISDVLHMPIGTVMSSLSRARIRLRKLLVDYAESRGLLNRRKE
jgi:RNA polymerase sigma-70 factor (ECF subfamily)